MRKTVFIAVLISAFLFLCPQRSEAGTPGQNFVSQAYLDLLNRPADSASLASYSIALDNTSLTPTQVAADIENTDEYRGIVVRKSYQLLLQRLPDSQGLSDGVNSLGSGETIEQLLANLAGSPEYLSDQGETSAGFLSGLYNQLLGRMISAGEIALGESALMSETRTQFAGTVMGSPEYRSDLVQGWYQQFLHRTADSTALNGFSGELGAGATDQTVISQIIGSPEYFQDAQSLPEPAIIAPALASLLLVRRRHQPMQITAD